MPVPPRQLRPAAVLLACTAQACVGVSPSTTPAVAPGPAGGAVEAAGREAQPSSPRHSLPHFVDVFKQDLTAGVLLPRSKPVDAEVMKVAGQPIHKSHVYDRLFESNPRMVKELVDGMTFEVLLAQQAKKHRIVVDGKAIDEVVAKEEKALTEGWRRDWGGRMSLDDYVQSQRGVGLQQLRLMLRRDQARKMYRYYVVRYLALRKDRVKVRVIRHRDRAVMTRILRQVREGADFHTLALRESDHASQRVGGELPPFGRDFESVFTDLAFKLKDGEVSDVLTTTRDGAPYYYLVYCVRHLPGRDVPFAAIKAELDRERLTNPLSPEEIEQLYRRLRSESESLNNGPDKR